MILPLLLVLVVLFLGGILIAAKEGLAAKPGLFEDPELTQQWGSLCGSQLYPPCSPP